MSWFIDWISDKTIISGILSMLGGLFGAMGAYFVSIRQMKKQFEKQDKDRVIELRINKLNESLELLNNFSSTLNITKGLIMDVEINYTNSNAEGFSHITKDGIFKEDSYQKLKDKRHRIIEKMNSVKNNRIFLAKIVNLNDFYEKTGKFIAAFKEFAGIFKIFDSNQPIILSYSNEIFDEKTIEMSKCYKELDKEVLNMIDLIEKEIERLLKV